MWRIFLSALMLTALTACATSYQPMGLTGGFSDKEVGDGIFEVNVKTNSWTSAETALGYAERRAYDVCDEAGYNEFDVVEDSSGCAEAIKIKKALGGGCESEDIKWVVECVNK